MIIISIHCFPHELSGYNRIVQKLNKCILKVNNPENFLIHSSLNINSKLVDWKNQTKEQQQKYCELYENISTNSTIKCENRIVNNFRFLGCNEHRRQTIKKANHSDTIIFLDCDLHFNEDILKHQEHSVDHISKFIDYFIITPNIVRLWDPTWDCIVHPSFLQNKLGMYKEINPNEISNTNYGNISLSPNIRFKWGGGWFNAISARLLKYINIPESFVGYGPDDTFVMQCCRLMRKKNMRVQQYILNNIIVCEDQNVDHSLVSLKHNIPNFRETANKHFKEELDIFYKKL